MFMVPGALRVTVLILSSLLSVMSDPLLDRSAWISTPTDPPSLLRTIVPERLFQEPQVVESAAGPRQRVQVGLGLEPVELPAELQHAPDPGALDAEVSDDPDPVAKLYVVQLGGQRLVRVRTAGEHGDSLVPVGGIEAPPGGGVRGADDPNRLVRVPVQPLVLRARHHPDIRRSDLVDGPDDPEALADGPGLEPTAQ